jgi:hypothetical protein
MTDDRRPRRAALVRSTIVIACLVGACVGTNPDWDGPVNEAETSEDGTSSGGISMEMSGDPSGATSDSEDSDPTEVDVCIDGPPSEGACPPDCTGGCSAGMCVIACEDQECENESIACPPRWPCRVVCDGKDRCKQAMILCPPMHACEVECTGEHSCEKLDLDCGDGPCAMSCHEHEHACEEAIVECGHADTTVSCDLPQNLPPTVQPADGSACACIAEGC